MRSWKDYNIKLPQGRAHEQEFGKAKKPILICQVCNIVYYKKSWHHNLNQKLKIKNKKPVLCPACQMIKNKQFEGRLTIKNTPPKFTKEIINLIQAYSQRAFERDPLDRLIKIKKENNQIVATFSENQLAVKTAKKIRDVFEKVKLEIKYVSPPSDVAEVEVNFNK